MSGGTDVVGTVIEDRRQDVGIPISQDPWPPGPYSPGPPWQQGGILPYYSMVDLDLGLIEGRANYYDQATVSDHQIIYTPETAIVPQSIVLRRLVVNFTPSS